MSDIIHIKQQALMTALELQNNTIEEQGLAESFSEICCFLYEYPEKLTKKSKKFSNDFLNYDFLKQLAEQHFSAYRKPALLKPSSTKTDALVTIIMQQITRLSLSEVESMYLDHQRFMQAENCVGSFLERYIDSELRKNSWNWCCGNLVKSIDFIKRDKESNSWRCIQIKNRDNSENSSSSAIRQGTTIEKWFRLYSKTGKTNWDKLSNITQCHQLNEERFIVFVKNIIKQNL